MRKVRRSKRIGLAWSELVMDIDFAAIVSGIVQAGHKKSREERVLATSRTPAATSCRRELVPRIVLTHSLASAKLKTSKLEWTPHLSSVSDERLALPELVVASRLIVHRKVAKSGASRC